jgi:hypothetical protein
LPMCTERYKRKEPMPTDIFPQTSAYFRIYFRTNPTPDLSAKVNYALFSPRITL